MFEISGTSMKFHEESNFHHPGVPKYDPGKFLRKSAGRPDNDDDDDDDDDGL